MHRKRSQRISQANVAIGANSVDQRDDLSGVSLFSGTQKYSCRRKGRLVACLVLVDCR